MTPNEVIVELLIEAKDCMRCLYDFSVPAGQDADADGPCSCFNCALARRIVLVLRTT